MGDDVDTKVQEQGIVNDTMDNIVHMARMIYKHFHRPA